MTKYFLIHMREQFDDIANCASFCDVHHENCAFFLKYLFEGFKYPSSARLAPKDD